MNFLIQLAGFLKLFLKDEEGITVVEYSIMAALIAAAIIAALALFAPALLAGFKYITGCFDGTC